jgi:hypothetical protein
VLDWTTKLETQTALGHQSSGNLRDGEVCDFVHFCLLSRSLLFIISGAVRVGFAGTRCHYAKPPRVSRAELAVLLQHVAGRGVTNTGEPALYTS